VKNGVFWDVRPCGSCKNRYLEGTSVLARATRRNIPEDGILHSHRPENLKSYIALTGWALWRRSNMLPVRYELGVCIPEDCIFNRHLLYCFKVVAHLPKAEASFFGNDTIKGDVTMVQVTPLDVSNGSAEE
jgi:hypothetical protein